MVYLKSQNYLFLWLTILLILLNKVQGSLKLIKIITRMPKPKDIGLIFDVTLENSNEEDNELLEFRIRANGYCCVNVTPEVLMEKMGRIVGGDFGFIAAGEIEKVSVIWPTVSLYNRVGLCPIAITSTNTASEECTIKQIIKFDTRFEILDPEGQTLRRQRNFIDCQNWDKDYLKNCTPVDCEERYFGLRNFYNVTSENCEKVPRCSQNYQLYDMFTNECVDTGVICSEEDFKETEFVNNIGKFITMSKKQQENQQNELLDVNLPQEYTNLFAHAYSERPYLQAFDHNKEDKLYGPGRIPENIENKNPAWLKGLAQGLSIVFATIAIYLLICFGIFLLVMWFARRSNNRGNPRGRGIILTPRHLGSSEENLPIYTTSSLMSQR